MVQLDNMNEQEQMQMLMSQLQDSNLRQSVLQYVNEIATGLDKDANSKALIETLARESVHNQKSTAIWKSRTKKSVAVGVVAVVLAIAVQFLVNYFTNELSKESHVDKQGAMVSTDGKMVKTQMEEMKVDADGKLLSRNGGAAVKTMPTLAKVALASSLPDATLMALDEITVHSDKGYTLQIKVHGFSRVPVLNSRCGNVVHFYTAWKGKVTLDSTDLSFDEATAAEFKNSGFSLATGGRRLAGKITVDGFAKALDGMRESGKWTCADVPLPTFSVLGDRKETTYNACGTMGNTESICFSKYGGLKIGVVALEGNLAAAVTSHTDQPQTQKLFVKSSSAVMNSKLYMVKFSEYAMHPGQQLVHISDLASGKQVQFQMETDKTRSHCDLAHNEFQKTDQEAKKKGNIDSEWHFEYLGTDEEDGRVFRHFRLMFSSEYAQFIYGDDNKLSMPNFAEFWDVAETMQPHRLVLGTDGDRITEFDSYKIVSDSDVQAAVETRTGKTIAELMKCSDVKETETIPEMDLHLDLSRKDADYYAASSSTKSKALARYLDATGSPWSIPDMCYEKCKSVLDALKNQHNDMCEGTALASALLCLQETEKTACSSSAFSMDHAGECHSNKTDRTLEESEDAKMEDVSADMELLVNETPQTAVVTRNAFIAGVCPTDHGGFYPVLELNGITMCTRFAWKISPKWSFILEFRWCPVGWGHWAFGVKFQACGDAAKFTGVGAPVYAMICIGGSIEWSDETVCPQVENVHFFGSAFASFEIGLDVPYVPFVISFINITLEFSCGMDWATIEKWCWWVHQHGLRRRRWWTWRRRSIRECSWKNVCDNYIKGYLSVTLLCISKAQIGFAHWLKSQVTQWTFKLFAWDVYVWNWDEVYSTMLYETAYDNAVDPHA